MARLSALFTLALILIFNTSMLAAQSLPRVRSTTNLDRAWKFLLGDEPKASDPHFDDSQWQDINLPHSFSIPYFRAPQFYVGYGWYRKHLQIHEPTSNRKFFLEFEGVFQDTHIFVNGFAVGQHQGGYTGFSIDITSALRDGDNIVAVRVDNRWNPRLNPRAGEHVFSGGIYRDVHLVSTTPIHVAWYGTFVTTPSVSQEAATISVKTEVENASAQAVSALLKTEILDPQGQLVATLSAEGHIEAGAVFTFDQKSDPMPHPELWNTEHPQMYKALSRVYVDGALRDQYTTDFGIRWFQWTTEGGFYVNGTHRYFHGADVHQDHAGWGDAVTNAGFTRDVQLVKDAGFDFIRGSHYPHDPAFADACDRLGVLLWSENSFWGMGGFGPDGYWNAGAYPSNYEDQPGFEESVEKSLREMIRINRNHPSIVAWSMTNEVFFSDPAVMPKVRTFIRELVELSHQLDPTRPAALGGVQRGDLDHLGDIAGYNGDGARLFLNPGIPSAVTEYGSVAEERPGTYDPHLGDLLGQRDFPWRSGQAIWSAFDHGSIAGQLGLTGVVDYYRLPKRSWYWYRMNYRHIPPPVWPKPGTAAGLLIATNGPSVISHADGTGDVQVIVTVVDKGGQSISNSPVVTLTIESGPGEFPTGRSITFSPGSDIGIRDGQAAIEFRSYYSGETIVRASSPGLKDATFVIQSDDAPPFVPGQSPVFSPPPYIRYTQPTSNRQRIAEIASDRPTQASSEAKDHPASHANDGKAITYWTPTLDTTTDAWWEVDLEGYYNLDEVNVAFPWNDARRYRVQVSDDLHTWKTVAEASLNLNQHRVFSRMPPETKGRGIRIFFPAEELKKPLGLTEVHVLGARVSP
jgi:hypothetical protein